MKDRELEPQVVLTVPLLVGVDGVDKMSKSLGNSIGVTDPPGEIYGKTMSIPDRLVWDWFLHLTAIPEDEIVTKIEQYRPEGSAVQVAVQKPSEIRRVVQQEYESMGLLH